MKIQLITDMARRCYENENFISASIHFSRLSSLHPSFSFSSDRSGRRTSLPLDTTKPYPVPALTVLDEISELNWHSVFSGYHISRNHYQTQIRNSNSCFALIESSWHAGRDSWQYACTSPNLSHQNAQALVDAIKQLKEARIPVLFWNKEDPLHYERFLPIASLCDHIFTTDQNRIQYYKKDIPGCRVSCIPFAASEAITNPANRFARRLGTICFAGTYYAKRHQDRKKQMDIILPLISKYGGDIYDRCFDLDNQDYKFPEPLKEFTLPSVSFRQMNDLYKSYDLFLNVNTVTNSPSMMSRRVYELLCSGTPVMSTSSTAIDHQFAGIVATVSSTEEAEMSADTIFSSRAEWARRSLLGTREVMTKHTYRHRFLQMLSEAFNISSISLDKGFFHLLVDASNAEAVILRLTLLGDDLFLVKHISLISDQTGRSRDSLRSRIRSISPALENVTFSCHASIEMALSDMDKSCQYISHLSSSKAYYAGYLSDLVLPFRYSGCHASTKLFCFNYEDPNPRLLFSRSLEKNLESWHTCTNKACLDSSAIKVDSCDELQFKKANSSLWTIESLGAPSIYVSDPFNCIQLSQGFTQAQRKSLTYAGSSIVCA